MKNNDFEYKYVAPTSEERKEIESIRNNYIEKNKSMSKLEYLRKLDGKVKNIPVAMSLIFGILGSFVFGIGLAMIIEWDLLIWGIVLGTIGFAWMILTYPFHLKVVNAIKDKYSEEIIKVSEELLNDEKQ